MTESTDQATAPAATTSSAPRWLNVSIVVAELD